jgi:hypothetical protein
MFLGGTLPLHKVPAHITAVPPIKPSILIKSSKVNLG